MNIPALRQHYLNPLFSRLCPKSGFLLDLHWAWQLMVGCHWRLRHCDVSISSRVLAGWWWPALCALISVWTVWRWATIPPDCFANQVAGTSSVAKWGCHAKSAEKMGMSSSGASWFLPPDLARTAWVMLEPSSTGPFCSPAALQVSYLVEKFDPRRCPTFPIIFQALHPVEPWKVIL
jgi:hypothetical protein